MLHLLPATKGDGYGSLDSPFSSWGGGVEYDPKRKMWFMTVAEMALGCGLGGWGSISQCVLAESTTPNGPYRRVKTLVNPWCHGPSLGRDPVSGKWLMNHMGSGRPRGGCHNCSAVNNGTGVTKPNAPSVPCPADGMATGSALVADDPMGAWTPVPKVTNGANCEPFFAKAHGSGPNDSAAVYFACPAGHHVTNTHCNNQNAFLSMSRAANLSEAMAGKTTSMPVTFVLAGTNDSNICFNWEDQNVWIDKRGNFHTLMHAFRGQPNDYPRPGCIHQPSGAPCTSVGGHAYSKDGMLWHISPVAPYTGTVEYTDGSTVTYRARERPHLLFEPETGDPIFLLNGVGNPPAGGGGGGNVGKPGADHTFTHLQPIAS